jgi:deoxyribodipyrimidine photo-lyase
VHEGFAIPKSKAEIIQCLVRPLGTTYGLRSPPLQPADFIEQFTAHPFEGGETNAMDRVHHLMENSLMTSYKATRNGLVGPEFSTKLSAYLAVGCLSARQIHAQLVLFEDGEKAEWTENNRDVLQRYRRGTGFGEGENTGTEAVRFELLWRDYMRLCVRKFGSRLFHLDGFRRVVDREWRQPVNKTGNATQDSRILERVLSGHTGIGLIDAGQRELFWTGYSSNRARQNLASFLAKHLNIDWRLGAEWFECMLVDYDVASNWGNWQYVAGVGNDPRVNRIFNPIRQACEYDPKGEYIITWVPELRQLNFKDNNNRPNEDRIQGLYQAWRIPRDEAIRLNIAHLEWVTDPLVRIDYQPRRPARARGNSRQNNRGRGNYVGVYREGGGPGIGRGRGNRQDHRADHHVDHRVDHRVDHHVVHRGGHGDYARHEHRGGSNWRGGEGRGGYGFQGPGAQ